MDRDYQNRSAYSVSHNSMNKKESFSFFSRTRRTVCHFAMVLFILVTSLSLMGFSPQKDQMVIRVGVYENAPKIFTNEQGEAAGFWPELLTYIAQREGWKLEWVHCSWENCLEKLRLNEIDLMPDVALTEERAEIFSFSQETVLVNWTRVYVPRNSTIQSLLDLDGKLVAGLAESVNLNGPEGLRDLQSNFNISSIIIEMPSYDSVLAAVEKGQVDAGVTNNLFGDLNESQYDVVRTSIIFQPRQIRFALPKNGEKTPLLISKLDEQIRFQKTDPKSEYYHLLDKYLGQQLEPSKQLPKWAIIVLAVAGGALILLGIIAFTSKALADRQTVELKAHESRMSALYESIPDLIFRYDGEGRFLDYHAKKEDALYLPPETFLGKTIHEVMPKKLADEALEFIRKAIATQKTLVYEYQLNMNGEVRDYESRYSACGKNEAMAIVRDITEEKQAEKRISFLNRLYATLSQINQTIVHAKDRDHLFRDICEVTILYGKFKMAWIGLIDEKENEIKPVASAGDETGYLDDLHIQYLNPLLGEGPTGTAVREGTYVVSRDIEKDPRMNQWKRNAIKNGFYSTASVPIRQNAQVVGAFTVYSSEPMAFDQEEERLLEEIGQDISFALDNLQTEYEHNLAMEDLAKSEERYQTLADISPVGIFRTDIDGHTTYVNPTWSKISGLPAAEAMGEGWLDAVHPEDKLQLSNTWSSVAKQKLANTADYRFIHPDGSVVWVIGQAVPEVNKDNEIIGYVGTITDITERKQIEDLRMAVERAEAADRLKSSFLATMSHELRTPLNSIIGFTGILLQKLVGPLSDEQEKQLKMVQGSARHLLDLINDVLDISKIEAGEVEIRLADFKYNESIEKSVEKIRPSAEKKGLLLNVSMNPAVLTFYSDQRRVEQVLLNLINNAIKFTEKGSVIVEYALQNGQVITKVTDTGIGIKPEDLDKLFVPFKQIDTGLTRQYEGTGLGLSICKRIIDLLDGKIWAESEWGKGSSFIFSLPLKGAEDEYKNISN